MYQNIVADHVAMIPSARIASLPAATAVETVETLVGSQPSRSELFVDAALAVPVGEYAGGAVGVHDANSVGPLVLSYQVVVHSELTFQSLIPFVTFRDGSSVIGANVSFDPFVSNSYIAPVQVTSVNRGTVSATGRVLVTSTADPVTDVRTFLVGFIYRSDTAASRSFRCNLQARLDTASDSFFQPDK